MATKIVKKQPKKILSPSDVLLSDSLQQETGTRLYKKVAMRLGAKHMEAVLSTIESLRKSASKHKDGAVKKAIEELSSVLTILKLPVRCSSGTLDKLSSIFKLSGLYNAFPALMFQLSATVITVIFHEKIKSASKDQDFTLQYLWEMVLKTVIDGVLDLLEVKSTPLNKTAAATALYPTICDMFYPKENGLPVEEPLTDATYNKSKLRTDKILGAKRIGTALSQTKGRLVPVGAVLMLTALDFMAIEYIIMLVGIVLPAHQAAAKRDQFAADVFTPQLFPRSDDIKQLIADCMSEWDPVMTKIINGPLASDLTFPQPFYISNIRTSAEMPTISDPFYNHKSAPGVDISPEKKKSTFLFSLKNEDVARFVEVVKARESGKRQGHLISETDRKVSKIAEGLNLEFDSHGQRPSTQQEKVAKVEQLWNSNTDSGLCEPTSPLVPRPSLPRDVSRDSDSVHDAIFDDHLSEVSDDENDLPKTLALAPKTPHPSTPSPTAAAASSVAKSSRPRVRIVLDSDDEAAIEKQQPRKTAPRKSAMKKPAAVESEDPGARRGDPVAPLDEQTPACDSNASKLNGRRETDADKPTNEKGARKRAKIDEDEALPLDEDSAESADRPTKRLRGTTDATLETTTAPVDPSRRASAAVFGARAAPATKRYGKKGRTSSPAPSGAPETDMDVDFDEPPAALPSPLPAARKVAKAPKQAAAVPKSRVAAMKGKAGQSRTVTKTEPAAKGPAETRGAVIKNEKVAIAEESAEAGGDTEPKPTRRSARVSGHVAPEPVAAQQPIVDDVVPKPIPKPKSKSEKPKKAPWEDMHLRKDNVETSDEAAPASGSTDSDAIPIIPQEDVTMIDLTQDSPKAKKIPTTHIRSETPKLAMTALQIPTLDAVSPPHHNIRPTSPVSIPEPLPAVKAKIESKAPSSPIKPIFVSRPATLSPQHSFKLTTPVKHSTPPRPKKIPTPPPPSPHLDPTAFCAPSRQPTSPMQRKAVASKYSMSPPERERELPSTSPVQREVFHDKAQFMPTRRTAHNRGVSTRLYKASGTNDDQDTNAHRPSVAHYVPILAVTNTKMHSDDHGGRREQDHKQDAMQGILEIYAAVTQILDEIQEVVVDKISRRFDHVRNDVRVGRDSILRGAAASLEKMCKER
ncbi:hypothetical protein C8J57DRAFT_1592630 [Mycena rebaudengoi]|nr:hypothetical protein C8J57DRAFT_1592630 [Mycena rebaudengoi]